MSIKEKVQQIIRQTKAEKAAELRRQEEARLRLAIEAQELVRQREILGKANLEKGKKILDSLGVQGVMADALNVLKEVDQEVELYLREGSIECFFGPRHESPTNLSTKTRYPAPGFTVKVHTANTVGYFVEKIRGERKTTVQLGVELEIEDSDKIWVVAARGFSQDETTKDVEVKENLLSANDPNLLEKIENCLARHIVLGRHTQFNPPDFGGPTDGW